MSGRIRQDVLRDGRDPDWRLAWEEQLLSGQRRAVEDAVRKGAAVADSALRTYAVGLAKRRLRNLKWLTALIPLHLGLFAAWIYFTCVVADPRQFWCWIFVAIGLLWLIAVPWRVMNQRSRLIAAMEANQRGIYR